MYSLVRRLIYFVAIGDFKNTWNNKFRIIDRERSICFYHEESTVSINYSTYSLAVGEFDLILVHRLKSFPSGNELCTINSQILLDIVEIYAFWFALLFNLIENPNVLESISR